MDGKGIFGAGGDVEGHSALMAPYANDRALLRRRIRAALVAGRNIPQVKATQVAAIGYCFGGMCVLELARSGADVLGVVSIHGILAPGDIANEAIRAKVLCLHGHDDPMAPPEQVVAFQQEMTAARVDWQVHCYGLTMHAFTNPRANSPDFGTVFNADAKFTCDEATKRETLVETFSERPLAALDTRPYHQAYAALRAASSYVQGKLAPAADRTLLEQRLRQLGYLE